MFQKDCWTLFPSIIKFSLSSITWNVSRIFDSFEQITATVVLWNRNKAKTCRGEPVAGEFVCNPSQSSPILTILVPVLCIITYLVFFYLGELLFWSFLRFEGEFVHNWNDLITWVIYKFILKSKIILTRITLPFSSIYSATTRSGPVWRKVTNQNVNWEQRMAIFFLNWPITLKHTDNSSTTKFDTNNVRTSRETLGAFHSTKNYGNFGKKFRKFGFSSWGCPNVPEF